MAACGLWQRGDHATLREDYSSSFISRFDGSYENFLAANSLSFEKIKEATTPRPDYLVSVDELRIVFELKDLAEDENFDVKTRSIRTSKAIRGRSATTFGAELKARKNRFSTEPSRASLPRC